MIIRSKRHYGEVSEEAEEATPDAPLPIATSLLPAGVTPKTFMQTVFFSMAISLTAQFILSRVRSLFAKRPSRSQ